MEKRKNIVTKINEKLVEIEIEGAFSNLAEFLRVKSDLPGTKVVCGEGDCGACTVLVGKEIGADGKLIYKTVNSCILPLYLLDGAHVVTVEGLKNKNELSPVQEKMVKCHGSQCGYCTPGFICSMTWMTEKLKTEEKEITEKRAKNFLTGNLCRCTGYQPIIDAALSVDMSKVELLKDKYHDEEFLKTVKAIKKESLVLSDKNLNIILPVTIEEALLIKEVEPKLKIVAGNTDLGVMANKGKGINLNVMSLTHIQELKNINLTSEYITVGATTTLSEFEDFIEDHVVEFKNLLHIFASPQIKNQGTLIGNVLNASPIGDTIPFLMAMNAIVVIESTRESREVVISEFYIGYKKLDLKENEIVTQIKIPRLNKHQKISLFKISMRKDLDISAVTFAGVVEIKAKKIVDIRLAYGGVGPTVIRLNKLESDLIGLEFNEETFNNAAKEVVKYITPLSDLRASREYRLLVAQNFVKKFYAEIKESV
jgi:xanthine dehydrogenase small subunit